LKKYKNKSLSQISNGEETGTMICPKCGAKHKKGITVCSTCNVPLENKLSHPGKPERLKLVAIYKTSDPIFISLAKSILKSEKIPHYFKGEGLQDLYLGSRYGIGNSTLFGPVEIQVDEKDVQRAGKILKQIERGKFEMPEDEGKIEDIETPESETNNTGKGSFKSFFAGLIIGILVTASAIYIYNEVQSYRQRNLSWTYDDDLNKDGKKDIFYYYKKGVLSSIEQDRNFDGKIDLRCLYKKGIVDNCESDDNFDGVFETKSLYEKGLIRQVEIDTNNDKKPEIIENYVDGIIYDATYVHELNRNVWKKEYYKNGFISEQHIDQDFDGKFDVIIKYNEAGRPIKTINLTKPKINSNLR
jgi:antitoxin component YwqK of YwqJK toxin-antitoxin module